jgi:nucleoside phosphorylase
MSSPKEIVILAPTPNEYRSVSRHVGLASLKHLTATVLESGPGKINAAFKAAQELIPRLASSEGGVMLIGAGTSGSMSLELSGGDTLVSNTAVISDWRMEDGQSVKVSPYGWFDYREPSPEHVEKMVLECRDPFLTVFLASLPPEEFKRGRILTSDAFVSGKEHKLSLGRTYGCSICDMESGAFAYVAGKLLGVPWLNIRVVADTLDDALNDYFAVERDMTEILGGKVVEALKRLDALL